MIEWILVITVTFIDGTGMQIRLPVASERECQALISHHPSPSSGIFLNGLEEAALHQVTIRCVRTRGA